MIQAPTIERALAIHGWMNRAELRWLADAAAKATIILEVGSFKGRSTRALADNCPGLVVACDPWDGYVNDNGTQAKWIDTKAARVAFEANLADHIASGRVVMKVAPFRTAFANGQGRMRPDMIFIDGDHRYEEVVSDIELAREILAPGGLLCGHDYGKSSWPGVKRAVDEFFQDRVQLCSTIWWVRP